MQVPLFKSFTAVTQTQKVDENRALSHAVERFKNPYNTLLLEEYPTNIPVLWNLHLGYTIMQWCSVCCYEFSCRHRRCKLCLLIRTCAWSFKSITTLRILFHDTYPRREAGYVWCLPPVWNLRAVIWFHFAISSLVLLLSPVTLSV